MIEDHEEGRLPSADGLGARSGDDLTSAHRLVGRDPVGEVRAHSRAEGPLERRGAETEHPLDVGVEPLVIEGRDREGELSGGGAVGGAASGSASGAVPQGHQLEGEQDDEEPEHDPGQDGTGTAAGAEAVVDGVDSGHASHEAMVSGRRRAAWLAAAALAVIVAVLAIVLVTRGQSSKARQDEVKHTAEKFALALSSYDYRHLDTDLARVRAMGVGNFRYQYEQILGGNSFETALKNNQAVATAKVTGGPFVAALGKNDARTFTVLEQDIKGKSSPAGEKRKVRVESILVRTPNGWRIDWVEIT